MSRSPNKLIPSDFTPTPSVSSAVAVAAVDALDAADLDAIAVLVASDGDLPSEVEFDREALKALAFDAEAGSTLLLPRSRAAALVLVGVGSSADLNVARLRDAAAAAVRSTARIAGRLGVRVPQLGQVPPATTGQAVTEGALLGRYRYTILKSDSKEKAFTRLDLLVDGATPDEVTPGIGIGVVTARAAAVARDLANTPPGHLTATDMADVAAELGERYGFEVEAFDKQQLIALGCGGILGVNAGSAEEPRMIVLRYTPAGEPTGHLGMVGKGIMYDSGGISLKPSDPMHLLMKMDMGGAGAILGTFTGLRDLGATAAVTAWLMCTDNMPSGAAYKLGDVLRARGGKTVEVKNTDAEGRLAMMDGLVLATEAEVDAIIDIATLTGASLMALGQSTAALFGNDQALLEEVKEASATVDEPVWQLPLERKYRKQLDSDIADITNLGGPYAGAATAALFLAEFVGATPWAHIDIAGTMQTDADDSWRSKGATGFGARILLEVARTFQAG